ncbi:MAG TPA: transcriptional regulator [Chloroflexi bacterium]|nr:MAG: transcriptional regulator [Chloroflexota bacterium]HDD55609.1 transcriptional regulator [Chloroflexota bacterium]
MVGNSVREYRLRKGITQAQLAELVGIARVSILAIEKGRHIPTIETALRLQKALEASLEELFWLKDDQL